MSYPQQQGPYGQMPASRPPSTAMLTVTSVISTIVGLAYVGLFVAMGISAGEEITTIQELKELKDRGAPITNTDADLAESITENELAVVIFYAGAALTVPLLVASLMARGGRNWTRNLASIFIVVPIAVIAFTVIHDINDGHPENAFALVFTIPAIVLAVFWWLPPTSRAMTSRKWQRQQGTPAMPGWQGRPPPVNQHPGQGY
jgi:ABC-type Fe3+ transport system permease subunit